MYIIDRIKKIIYSLSNGKELSENPNNKRFTYINDIDDLRNQAIDEYMIWYIGDENEFLNYYTNEQIYGNYENPIYNRNRQNYFWGLSSVEKDLKRVHSGVPKAIIDILVSIVGTPDISCNDKEIDKRVKEIAENNNLLDLFSSTQLPMTLVQGYGAYKINANKSLSNFPIIQYYTAKNVKFICKSNVLIAIIYIDFYSYKDKNYVLYETRSKRNQNSYIKYELYELSDNNFLTKVPLSTIPDLSEYKDLKIEGLNEVLGVPCRIIYDPQNEEYGASIFQGKIALFDDLDLNMSQNSQTTRVSTPVEYIPSDLLSHGKKNGKGTLTHIFNRQFIKLDSVNNGDGDISDRITTTQPKLDFSQYNDNAIEKIKTISMGIISPSTLGLSSNNKSDSSESQREKEKVTIMTRNKIISHSSRQLKKLLQLCLIMQDLMNGDYNIKDYSQVEIAFSEFADPSFESKISSLGPSWRDGEISTEKYVLILWGDKLSSEDREKEIKWLDDYRKNRQELSVQAKNPGIIGGKEEFDESTENTDGKIRNMGKNIPNENKPNENIQGIKKYNSKE